MDRTISPKIIVKDAWLLAKQNLWILLGFTAVQFFFLFVFTSLAGIIGVSTIGVFFQNMLLGLFDAFFTVAFYQVFFKLIDEPGDPELPDFVPNLMKALNFLIVKLIIGLLLAVFLVTISMVYFYNSPAPVTEDPFSMQLLPYYALVAVPIIFMTIRFCFVICFIVDQESGSSESLTQSWAITKGHFWLVFQLFLIILGLNILGAMAFVVGLLFTVPFSSLILIIAYRHLVNSYVDEEEIVVDDILKKDGN